MVGGRLNGRVALVTGGAHGIGRASAARLGAEGARVALADLDLEAAREAAAEQGAAAFAVDVADPAAVERLVTEVAATLGPVEILHSNAGVIHYGTALELGIEQWDATFAVNVRAAFLLARAVLPAMLERGRGVQVFTGSTSGWAGDPELPAYASSKAALINLVRQLSSDFAGGGVRFACVNPGWIDTGFDARALPEVGRADLDKAVAADVPMRRWGRPEEVAAAVAFLASDDASYITGTALDVDGGGAGKG